MAEKTELQKRYEAETRCLEYLREFYGRVKAELQPFNESGYIGVTMSDDHISITNASKMTAPQGNQICAWADPRKKKMTVVHLTNMGPGNAPEIVRT